MVGQVTKYIYDANGRVKDIKDKASPELLDPVLRKLPGELVTKELEDPDRAFHTDAPHVIEEIVHSHAEKIKEEDDKPAEPVKSLYAGAGEYVPLSQREIDYVRMRVISSLIGSYLKWISGSDPSEASPARVRHLWFPENNVNNYELREGNPPSDTDRPGHMRGFRVECDIENIPKPIHQMIQEAENVRKERQQ